MSDRVTQASGEGMPANWRKVALGEIYDIGSSKRVMQKQWKDSGVPFYRAREIVKLARDGFVANDLFISEAHFAELEKAKGVPQPGDLMVSAVGTLGACYAVKPGDRFYFKDASVLSFRPIAPIDPSFMQYAFLWNGLLDQVKSGEGATVGTFTIARAKATEFLLPPLDEQKRIVAVLDQAFAALDRARAHTEANLADALQLFEKIVAEELESRRSTWESASLGSIYDVRDGTHDSPKYQDEGRALITSKNLGREGLNFNKVKFISEEDYLAISKRSAVHQGDVLFAMIGTIGSPVVVDVMPDFAIKNVALFKMRDGRDGRCLRYILSSSNVRKRIENEAKGTTQKFVGLGYLRALEIPLPPLDEEQKLIERLSTVEKMRGEIALNYQKKVTDLANLRQSLLQKAFSGELT